MTGGPVHPRAQADVPRLVAVLARHDVRYVVTGSVAARLHGVALEHRDFDVVPDPDPDNLRRLFDVLREIEAMPFGFGHWVTDDDGRRRWITEEATPERFAAWAPRVDDPASYDHLFPTRLGDFDVVPELTGRYEVLVRRAVRLDVEGVPVFVAHVDDLAGPLEAAGKPRHLERLARLRALQRAVDRSEPMEEA